MSRDGRSASPLTTRPPLRNVAFLAGERLSTASCRPGRRVAGRAAVAVGGRAGASHRRDLRRQRQRLGHVTVAETHPRIDDSDCPR